MKKFEIKEIYASDVAVDDDNGQPFRMLNVQIRVNYPVQRSLLGPPEDYFPELTEDIRDKLLNFEPPASGVQKVSAPPAFGLGGSFGWYKVY